jgi:hypothetical protein
MRPLRTIIRLIPILRLIPFLGVLACYGGASTPAMAQAKCGTFFDKSGATGVPPGMLAMIEFGHEVVAAQDCVTTGNVATACEHWRRALRALDNVDPETAAQFAAGIRNLMQQHNCS